MEGLSIHPEGVVKLTRWVYDEVADEGGYVSIDVSDRLPMFLMEPCVIETGVTLKDIFMAMEPYLALFGVLYSGYLPKIAAAVLSGAKTDELDDDPLVVLELYQHIEHDGEATYRMDYPYLHGLGAAPDGAPYCVSYCNPADLADLPVVISKDLLVVGPEGVEIELPAPTFTLNGILYGILHELSWIDPDKREAFRQELYDSITEAYQQSQ